MELQLYAFGILIVIILFFISIERPYLLASLLVFLFIYKLNLEMPGPLDARGLLTILLFARLFLFDRHNYLWVKKYLFQDLNGILLSFFLLISSYIAFSYYGELRSQIQQLGLLLISLILGFIIIANGQGKKVFFPAMVLAGVLSTIDLIFSAVTYGSLRTRSLLKILLLGDHTDYNHNPIGLVCGLALVLVYIFFVRKQISRNFSVILMLILILGVLLSTSRSTLIALILVLIISFMVQKEIKLNPNKIFAAFFGVLFFFISFYFIYHALLSSGNIKSSLIDQTYYRLYEEPMSLLGGNQERVFTKFGDEKEGNARGRLNRTLTDIDKYSQLDLDVQLLGFGIQGYMNQNFAGDYHNAHNGYLLLLIERGIIGFLTFIFVVINLSSKSFRLLKRGLINTPIVYVFLALLFYSTAQNGELTSNLAFLLLGAMIGNTKEALISEKDIATDLTPSEDLVIEKQ